MDRLTLIVLAAAQPRRAVMYTAPGHYVTSSVECARCSLNWIDSTILTSTHAEQVLADTELVHSSEFKTCCTCRCPLEFD